MATKRTGLGKGLDSLIPAAGRTTAGPKRKETVKKTTEAPAAVKETAPAENSSADKEGVTYIKIGQIEPNREQPRSTFDEDALMELADSIRQFGIIQPLIVQKQDNYYNLIAGERRWRAAKIAGLKEVPVIVRDYTEQEVVEIALIENIQREDLNPIEEARAYKRLLEEFALKQEEIAERVSKSRTAIANSMRLLKLDDRVQDMLISGMLSPGHGRTLLGLEDGDAQYRLAGRVFDENLSVRETELLVKSLKNPKKKKKTARPVSENRFIYQDMEEKMKHIFGTKVMVAETARGRGKIEIEYYSDDELERIYHLLMSAR